MDWGRGVVGWKGGSPLLKVGKKNKAGFIVPGCHSSWGEVFSRKRNPLLVPEFFQEGGTKWPTGRFFWASVSGCAAEGGSQGS